MGVRDTVRRFTDKLGIPSFSGTPFPDGHSKTADQSKELGGTGTFNFGGFIRGEDFNPEMDSLTAIKNLDIMRRSDAQTNAALQVIMQPIRSADHSVDPADGVERAKDGEEKSLDEQVADFVEWNLFSGDSIVWDDFIRQALLMLVFGHYVFEKVWDIQEDGEYAGKLYYRKFAPRPPKTIWQWFTDESGELISIKQLAVKAGTYQFLDIPVDKLVVFVYNKEGDNYAGTSILRSAYPHWLIKNNLYIVDAIRAVRFGAGIPRAALQKGYSPNKQEADNLVATLSGMSSHQFSYIIQPENVVIDILVPSGSRGGAQILPTIEHHNEQITANVMARFLDMGGKSMGGSKALGSSAMDFFTNAVISIGDLIEDVIDKQIVRPLVDANFDINQLKGYPKFRFSGIKQDNLKDMAAIVQSLAQAGMGFTDLETQNTFRNRLGLPEVEQVEPGPQAPMPGGATPPASPASPPASGGTPQQPLVDETAQGMRPAQQPGANAVAKAAPGVDRSEQERNQAVGVAKPGAVAIANKPRTVEGMAKKTTLASSGDADEEGHTSLREEMSSQLEATSTTKGTHAVRMSAMWEQDGLKFRRSPTPLEFGVLDLREMPKRLDSARDALLATLKAVREEQCLRIAEQVAHLPVGAPMVKAPLVGKLTSDALKIVEDVFNYGHQSVEKELQKQGSTRDAGPVHKVAMVEDSSAMPFPVDLSTFPEPTTEDVKDAPVVRMDLESLTASQASLTQRKLVHPKMDTSLPIVVSREGVNYIYDGHHRAAQALDNGAKQIKVRVVAMRDSYAFAALKGRADALPHLEASVGVKIQSASDRLVSSATAESLRLKRAGWSNDEVEDALKIHLGELADSDLERLAGMEVNEAFSLGRTSAAEANSDLIGTATYSALMDISTCDVCEGLDGQDFDINSDEYEENLPPNQNCLGKDNCRCTYIYSLSGEATEMSERSFGGKGSGWTREGGHISSKVGKLSEQHTQAIADYCGGLDESPAYAINRALRGKEKLDKQDLEEIVKPLDEAIAASELTSAGSLYRGGELPNLKEGATFTDKAFVSTSKSIKTAKEFFTGAGYGDQHSELIEIRVPAGTKALDVNKAMGSSYEQAYEHEVLLGRGHTFKIVSKSKGRTVVELVK